MANSLDKFRKGVARWSGNIGSAGISDAVVKTVPLASTSGLPTDTAVMITVNRVDTNGKKTGNYEGIVGVVSGSNLIDCIRGVEGTAQAWTGGTVVEVLHTASNINELIDGILAEHNQDGTHKDTLVTSLKATGAEITTGTEDAKIVTPKAIADATVGKLGAAWATWTPSWTNFTKGSATIIARYCQIGKLVTCRLVVTLAADSSVSGVITFSLPVTAVAGYNYLDKVGIGSILDNGTAVFMAGARIDSTTTCCLDALVSSTTYLEPTNTSATVPMTWAVNDQFRLTFTYEAA